MDQAGHPFELPMNRFSPGRGDHAERVTRPILRRPLEASGKRANPTDASCPEAPYPRATTDASLKCQTLDVPPQSRGFTLRKITET